MFKFKSIVFLTIAFLVIFSCEKKSKEQTDKAETKEYTLYGTLKNYQGKVFLKKMQDDKFVILDSTNVESDGTFKLKTVSSEPDYFVLSANDSTAHLVVLDNNKVTINADANDMENSFSSEGSKGTREYVDFKKRITEKRKKHLEIQSAIKNMMAKNNLDSLKILDESLNRSFEDLSFFTKAYADSIIPSLAVFNVINYLDNEQDFDYLKALSVRLTKEMPNSKYTAIFKKEMDNMLAMEQKLKESGVEIGSVAPDINLLNPEGNMVSLKSLRGKVVLLDFWASWCGPCRAENPNVVKVYQKYKNKGFDIFSVSVDKNKVSWQTAILQDKLTWTHVSDLKFWESSVVPQYGIQGIPATYLLDKEGKVIAKNLRGIDLEKKLEEVLK